MDVSVLIHIWHHVSALHFYFLLPFVSMCTRGQFLSDENLFPPQLKTVCNMQIS